MKEASGELNMTVITIIAIAAIATLFGVIILPRIQSALNNQFDTVEQQDYRY